MSKSRKKLPLYRIQTGDGKFLTVDPGICDISSKLSTAFNESGEIYLENSFQISVQMVINFYTKYSKFTDTQKKKWDDPILFVEKIGKPNQPDSDLRLVESYYIYTKMEPREFFELMKTAWDMRVIPLVKILAFITTSKIINKSTDDIETMLNNP